MFWRQWETELIKRYRLNREGIKLVVELVRDAITSPTNRNKMFGNTTIFSNRENASLQCRRFRNIATISQPCHKPNHQRALIKANFMAIAGMPGVVGAVDGTHIQIIAPPKDEDVFVNRKKVHTSTRRLFLMQLLTFLMLRSGPQGLPMIRWLSLQDVLTPLNPQPGAQLKYSVKNIVLALCRLLFVESIFIIVCCVPPYSMLGHTKIHDMLWREDVITVITVCAILHNRYGLLFKVLNSGDMLIG
ncbi:putative nuclease HARBI1 [Merluccius polli]|uniref:Nuclease HARBI1 n=1 Tax=Merluccius polli TaxID=89951 RepID=A0AA47NTJ2_MERPO|nr:putative nuclease HARBI1 [Merluccius polli]